MSMSTHIIGFVPPDEKWKKMKAIWDACEVAGIEAPREVWKFFNDQEPDERGVEVSVPHKEWGEDMRQGIEINVDEIPKHVKTIRFYNSW